MFLIPRYNNAPPLPFDVLQEIAQYCDKSTLEAYCSASHHLREAIAPCLFKASKIRFGVSVARRITEDVSDTHNYQAWASKLTEQFEQLSASRYAKYIRTLSYTGVTSFSRYPEGCNLDDEGIRRWQAAHHKVTWPVLTRTLGRFAQLKELSLSYVEIDDRFVIVLGTLHNLQDLTLDSVIFSCSMDLAMHHNVRPSRDITYWPIFDPDGLDSKNADIRAMFFAGACSKIKSLQIEVYGKDAMQDELYRILSTCPLTEELSVVVMEDGSEKTAMADRPTAGLDPAALPMLWSYYGPDFYTPAIIKGRPVHKIHLYPSPSDLDETNITDWFKDTFSGTTVPVKSFSVKRFPDMLVDDLLRVIPTTLPSLEELVVDVAGSFDDEELDCLVDDLSTGVCAIPASLKSLSLQWNYEDADITYQELLEGVQKILAMPEKLKNLESLNIASFKRIDTLRSSLPVAASDIEKLICKK
ncbi:hypothetical protein JR316_0006417 [Psilocybe cubensis]|uniref:Uncharacterized protein n=1 Tax=Psilocybe cubensis TaxID=181762 RepID=A0ACB8H2M1_PSICU|nr:hypothetical protein JR316_0006417 [Psilocybe cubensis]KAH9481887.1 hypothetical protein JR316_0006417 [Psilocybe cubensis]